MRPQDNSSDPPKQIRAPAILQLLASLVLVPALKIYSVFGTVKE